MDHTGGSSQPVQHPQAGGAAKLRQAWRQGIDALGPDAELPGLRSLLDSRLTGLEQSGALDEASLLTIAEEAAQLALDAGSADLARTLSKRLRRSIYEFLLSLDATPVGDSPAAPVAPLEPSKPARWGQVLIGVEEVEAAQLNGDPAGHLEIDLDRVVGADDAITAEVARANATADDGQPRDTWTEAEAGRLLDLADAANDEVTALRALLEEAMQSGLEVELPAIGLGQGDVPPPPAEYAVASAAAQAYAATVAEARAAADARAEAEARAAAEAEAQEAEAQAGGEADALAASILAEVEDAEDASARAVLLRLRVMEAMPPPGVLDPDALRVPSMFRREPAPPPAAVATPAAVEPAPAPEVRPKPAYIAPAVRPQPAYVAPPVVRQQPAFVQPAAPVPAPEDPEAPLPQPPSAFPIAPREGFHLTDPSMIDLAMSAPSAQLPAPPVPATPPVPGLPQPPPPPSYVHDDAGAPQDTHWSLRTATPPAGHPGAGAPYDPSGVAGGWNVRQSPRQQMLTERMAQKRREEAVRAAQEAASIAAALAEPEHRKRRRGRTEVPERIADVETARELVEQQLRRKRCAEAAALLQRLAAEFPGREAADLALDSGDRCLALGQNRSATNCYLAGWRADPYYEAPLWRLADVCLTDREIALATGYLERIAELLRSRGDDAGALAVYRKITAVAPDREDIRRLVRLAQATGRLES